MREENQATLLLLLGTLFWGMTFVFVKEGISIINLFTFLAWRFILAGLALAAVFFRKVRALNKNEFKYGLILGAVLAISFFAQTIGLQYTTASKAAFITGLSVVFIPVIIAAKQKTPPSVFQVTAVILSLAGLGLLTLSGSLSINIGDLWMLFCAVTFAWYVILVGRYTHRFDAVSLALIQFFFIGILSLAISIVSGNFLLPQNGKVWQAILFTSFFATTFTYTVQNYYQKFVSEIKTAIIFSLEPLFAAVTAWLYLNEEITWRIIFGGTLIFTGMLISEIRKK